VIGPGTLEVFQKMGNSSFLTKDPSWAIDFAPDGTLLGLGDILTRNRYAALLERIATEGPDCFYKGDIARSTIRAVQNAGGIMTAEDLAKYKPIQRDVMTITYRNFKITSLGAPSGGPVVLSILKTVEGYKTMGDLQSLNLSIHRLDQATRFGFGAVIIIL
jgi:gamma-glutamyltranspeptidase/glutathione hydrolase